MKYKAGDKVRIKSIDWYNKNKNKFGKVWTSGGQIPFDKCMSEWCGKVMTISHVRVDHYTMVEDLVEYWTDEMIEGLVDEETTSDKVIEEAKTYWDSIKDAWICPEGYTFKDENGNVINATKIVLEKKKKEYPKTYEECCKVLGVNPNNYLSIRNPCCNDGDEDCTNYELGLLGIFDSLWVLRFCRDAYWKIYGEEMGLDGPWGPDWTNDNAKYSIYTIKGVLTKAISCYDGAIFVFPTEEMRDAFFENFKELIEQCKELL